jgi:Zn-finger nucleic acid-binding protein
MARQDLSILESPKKIRMKVLYNKGIMRVSASPAGDRNPGMTCPVCSSPLAEAFYEGAPVHTCSSCGGMLVREDVVPRVLVRDEYDFPEQVRKAAGVIASNRMPDVYKRQAKGANAPFAFNCPVCNGKMKRGFFSSAYPVEVDFCESCGLYWFDKEELETMQCVYELSKHGA